MLARAFPGTLLLFLAAACSSYGGLDPASSAVKVTQALPAPDAVDLSSAERVYRVGPYDTISVDIFGAPDLHRQGAVDAAGSFGLPLIGPVQASGRTTTELAAEIAAKLRGPYLRDPQVSVNVVEVRSQRVTVDGAVRQPGIYPVIGRMTLQQVVATAQGATDSASLSKIAVFRTVNNKQMAALFDLKDIREGRMEDPQIYGNDVVVVGESAARKTFRDIVQALPALGVFSAIP